MTKVEVIRKLVNNMFGLPEAIKVYDKLSSNGLYEITSAELREYIKENGYG